MDDDDDNFDDGRTKYFFVHGNLFASLKIRFYSAYKQKGRIFKAFLASLPLYMSFLFEILRLTV